jgi:hypothetical protein
VAAAKACLEMRQYRADQDPHVRLGHGPEHTHGHAVSRHSQVDIPSQIIDGRAITGVLIDDLVTHALPHRGLIHGMMSTDANADGDIGLPDARTLKPIEHDRQGLAHRGPARRVVDDDCHFGAGLR